MDKATRETAGGCREEKNGDHLEQSDDKIVGEIDMKEMEGIEVFESARELAG